MPQKTINKNSLAEKILKLNDFLDQPKTAEEIKDRFGHNFKLDDIRVNLLYLLRRGKLTRKKEDKIYRYKI